MSSISVAHSAGSYPVLVAQGAVGTVSSFLRSQFPNAKPVVIADAAVANALGSPLPDADLLTFPAGEHHKNRDEWLRLTDELLGRRYGRDTIVVAFGGGVTTDLVGFVAATLHRGVPWVAVPTTTLAMIDASIGGKTGVDTPAGKNLVGAFHPPSAVFIDPAMLLTLPQRGYLGGIAEAVKHAAILDAEYGTWMMAHAEAILTRELGILTELIQRSVALKGSVVSGDEREGDRRAILNAGHTVGHALEQVTDFLIPHGEAVAIGLVLETTIAEEQQVAERGTAARVAAMFAALNLPTAAPLGLDRAEVLEATRSDKKNRGGVVRAALLSRFGEVARSGSDWTQPLDLEILARLLT